MSDPREDALSKALFDAETATYVDIDETLAKMDAAARRAGYIPMLNTSSEASVEKVAEAIYRDMWMNVRPWSAVSVADRDVVITTARAVLATLADAVD